MLVHVLPQTRDELNPIILLNGHSIKLPPKYVHRFGSSESSKEQRISVYEVLDHKWDCKNQRLAKGHTKQLSSGHDRASTVLWNIS